MVMSLLDARGHAGGWTSSLVKPLISVMDPGLIGRGKGIGRVVLGITVGLTFL